MVVTLEQKNIETEEPRKVWTEEEFMSLPDEGYHYELVNGELIMSNAGMRHGEMAVFISAALSTFVRSQRLGSVCDSSTGFRMKSGNYRSPDVSFVAKERLQASGAGLFEISEFGAGLQISGQRTGRFW